MSTRKGALCVVLTVSFGCGIASFVMTADPHLLYEANAQSAPRPRVPPPSPRNTVSQPSVGLDPQALLDDITKRYDSLSSYECKGTTVFTMMFDGNEIKRKELSFEIEYKRAGKSTFKWLDRGSSNILHLDRNRVWLTVDGRLEKEYSNAGAGLLRVSLGQRAPSFRVGTFLLRQTLNPNLRLMNEIENLKVVGEQEHDGRICILIGGYARSVDAAIIYWIDKKDLLLRRVDQDIVRRRSVGKKEFAGISRETELYTDIKAN